MPTPFGDGASSTGNAPRLRAIGVETGTWSETGTGAGAELGTAAFGVETGTAAAQAPQHGTDGTTPSDGTGAFPVSAGVSTGRERNRDSGPAWAEPESGMEVS